MDKTIICHLFNSEYQGDFSYFLSKYKEKGFKINQQQKTATNNRLVIFFIDTRNDRYREKIRGMRFDDITGGYDNEDLSRLNCR